MLFFANIFEPTDSSNQIFATFADAENLTTKPPTYKINVTLKAITAHLFIK
jgi:hypothetical protein